MALRDQIKIYLAGLEKYLYLPSFFIDPDDLIFGQIRVCADKSDPILPVLLVADTDDLCRNLLIFPDHDIHREKISAAARKDVAELIPEDIKHWNTFFYLGIVFTEKISNLKTGKK